MGDWNLDHDDLVNAVITAHAVTADRAILLETRQEKQFFFGLDDESATLKYRANLS